MGKRERGFIETPARKQNLTTGDLYHEKETIRKQKNKQKQKHRKEYVRLHDEIESVSV
jgi:hypothetical protein